MEDSGTAQIVDDTDFSLIDVSAADDDFLLASSSDVATVGNPGDTLPEEAYANQKSDSTELEKPRKYGKCNLRKSLAWDSAFFTNAGVLEPEELSSIIEGAETNVKQKQFLPGIEEDISKSYDSVSTFESDNLTIESLEADLFCDIRASIQRASRPSAQGNCGSSKKQREKESTNGSTMKAVEISTANVVKPKLASKKPTTGVPGPSRILKPGSISKQAAKPAVRSKESKPSLPRLPVTAVKPSSIGAAATKRASIGAGRANLETNTTGNSKGKVASLSKGSTQANSSKTLPKPMASSRFTTGSSVSGRPAAVRSSRSSCGSSSSSTSEIDCKSQRDVNRSKINKNATLPPGSKIRAPSRVAVKSKCRPGDSHLSDYLKSTSKLSPSTSPTSSISGWSTESSSSCATVNLKLVGLTGCPTSTDEIVDNNVSQSQNHCIDYTPNQQATRLAVSVQSVKQPSTSTGVPPPHAGSAKPSGLRMPSAKLGFFDGAKAAAKTPSSGLRSRPGLPCNLPGSVALNGSPSTAASNPKAVVKHEPYRTDMSQKSVQLNDHSMDLPKILHADNGECHSETSSEVSKDISVDRMSEEHDEALNEGKLVADPGSDAAIDICLVADKKEHREGELPSSTNQAISVANDLDNKICIMKGVKDESMDVVSVCTSEDVVESDSLRVSSVNACLDVGEIMEHGPTDENLESSTNQAISVANDLDNKICVMKGVKDESMDVVSVCTSEDVVESDSLRVSSVNACLDVGESMEPGPTDENLESSTNQAISVANDLDDKICMMKSVKDESMDVVSVCTSEDVVESDSLRVSSVNACLDVGEIMEHGPPTDENLEGQNVTIEGKCDEHEQVDGSGTEIQATENELKLQSKSNDINSVEAEKEASVGGKSQPSPIQATRTPFATKNAEAHSIEIYNSSSGSAVFEALVKFDTVPSSEEEQKENC